MSGEIGFAKLIVCGLALGLLVGGVARLADAQPADDMTWDARVASEGGVDLLWEAHEGSDVIAHLEMHEPLRFPPAFSRHEGRWEPTRNGFLEVVTKNGEMGWVSRRQVHVRCLMPL